MVRSHALRSWLEEVRAWKPARVVSGGMLLLGTVVAAACENNESGGRSPQESPPSEMTRLAGTACEDRDDAGSDNVVVYLEDGRIRPDSVAVTAGREVRLLVCNGGAEPYELQIGRTPTESTFADGFFDGVTITEMRGGVMATEEPGSAPESPLTPAPSGAPHAHAQLFVYVRPGEAALLRFVPPSGKRGTWRMGCFLEDHFEQGMRGTFVVR